MLIEGWLVSVVYGLTIHERLYVQILRRNDQIYKFQKSNKFRICSSSLPIQNSNKFQTRLDDRISHPLLCFTVWIYYLTNNMVCWNMRHIVLIKYMHIIYYEKNNRCVQFIITKFKVGRTFIIWKYYRRYIYQNKRSNSGLDTLGKREEDIMGKTYITKY